MKKIIIPVLLLFLLALTGCSSSDKLVGNWQRDDGSIYNGMQVKVEKLDTGEYRASIIKADKEAVFKEGDVKWKDVKKVSEDSFDLNDFGSGEWHQMNIKMADKDTLNIRNLVDTGEIGSTQKWIRASK
ncbi:hypothetical protein D3C87_1105700 [compost metagenome]